MGVFRRRRRDDDELDAGAGLDPALEAEAAGADEPGGEAAPAVPARPAGPWDEADAPEGGPERLDLGGLRVPVPPQTEVRVEVGPQGEVVAATFVRGQSVMQVNAFAAPRTEGIWVDVRAEIAASVQQGGGRAEESEGAFGPELVAAVPAEVPGQGRVLAPARFLGVDGPRWFLRALITGPAVSDPAEAAAFEEALRGVVVVRGTEPMAVRDPLPLRLPPEVAEQAAAQAAAQAQAQARPGGGRPAPAVPERGPEITETR